MRRCIAALCALLPVLVAGVAAARTWRSSGVSDFARGRLDGVSMLSTGELLLAPDVKPVQGLEANYVWDMAAAADGRIFVGTQAPAMLGVIEKGAFKMLHRTSEQAVLSVLPLRDGSVLAATAPRGIIYRVAAGGAVAVFKELQDGYVWDMALGKDGAVHCATGPNGRLVSIAPDGGEVKEVFRAPQRHLMCLAVDPRDGAIYTGTEPDGLVYRIAPDGKVSVLYDCEEGEVRALLLDPDGRLYVATAQSTESGRPSPPSPAPPAPAPPSGGGEERREGPGAPPPQPQPQPQLTERAAPGAPAAANALYRIERDGRVALIAKAPNLLMLSLVLMGDKDVLVGTGPRGRLIAVERANDMGRVITDLSAGYVSAMATEPDGSVVVGTSGPGEFWHIGVGYRAKGAFESDVFDAGHISRWGRVSWKASVPARTQLAVSVRTGNTRRPDKTWSDWSEPGTMGGDQAVNVPMGRFAQVRCQLSTEDASTTPTLIELGLSYGQLNLRPSVQEVRVDDKEPRSAGKQPSGPPPAGRPDPSRLVISWKAEDPNDDRLVIDLYYRGIEESAWAPIKKDITEGNRFEWQTDRLPDGRYLVRVVADDRPSRPPEEALQDDLVTQPIIVDNHPPEVLELQAEAAEGGAYVVRGLARDSYSAIMEIKVSRNGGDWKPVFPADGIFDSSAERFVYRTGPLPKGEHVFVCAAADERDNIGSGKLVITVP